MSKQGAARPKLEVVLGDTDLFFFYLRGGSLEAQAEAVIRAAAAGDLELKTSSEVYDDAISAIRAEGVPLAVANSFVADMKSIRHTALPMSAEIAEEALELFRQHGGRRKLSYFDSFHVATARRYDLTMLTSDKFILQNAEALELEVAGLSTWG